MKNSFGSSVCLTLFGESHGPMLGAVLDGLAPGLPVDEGFIARQLELRRPWGAVSTARQEPDPVEIVSGVFEGKTTGTPLCLLIPNTDTRSRDYAATRALARPGHVDYTAHLKYRGFEDYRGGGHFSGRVTAPLVAAGAIPIDALRRKGIRIGSRVARCGGVADREMRGTAEELDALNEKRFAVLDEAAGARMRAAIEAAAAQGDSVGGVLETWVLGLPGGLGEPWFDSVESLLSHALFSIPGVKGVEFGAGFGISELRGSEANDAFYLDGEAVRTRSNHNGGVNGGISNGMPLRFRCALKPTPSIAQAQETVDFLRGEGAVLNLRGRHDPCIVHRARVVADSLTALVLCDLLAQRYGTDWLRGE